VVDEDETVLQVSFDDSGVSALGTRSMRLSNRGALHDHVENSVLRRLILGDLSVLMRCVGCLLSVSLIWRGKSTHVTPDSISR
jgi:hypothetical protein